MTKRPSAAEAKARILQAALALFAEKGTRATVADIAERAEVNEVTIYRHFKHGEIWTDVLKLPEFRLTDIYDALDKIAASDPLPPIEAVVKKVYQTVEKHPYSMSLIYHAWSDPNPSILEFSQMHWSRLYPPLIRYFARGVEKKIFHPVDPEATAQALWGTMVYQNLRRNLGAPVERPLNIRGWRQYAGQMQVLFHHLLVVKVCSK